jgi:hypothetical protein
VKVSICGGVFVTSVDCAEDNVICVYNVFGKLWYWQDLTSFDRRDFPVVINEAVIGRYFFQELSNIDNHQIHARFSTYYRKEF